VRRRLLLLLALLAACKTQGAAAVTTPDAHPPERPVSELPPVPTGEVTLLPVAGAPVKVRVEVVKTVAGRTQGLMYRKALAADAGMLFLFAQDEVHSFWMKNTYVALDMIFIDAQRTVVGVVENATPRTLDARTVGLPSRHVLEVLAGFARRHGIEAGTRVVFDNISEENIEP
jgi:uncharacterized membrane protein (UPF0127 family)